MHVIVDWLQSVHVVFTGERVVGRVTVFTALTRVTVSLVAATVSLAIVASTVTDVSRVERLVAETRHLS